MTFVMTSFAFDPVAFEIGPIVIRWYALAYIAGLLLGWWLTRILAKRGPDVIKEADIDDFLVWATLGVILGGRLGYVLFYKPSYYLAHPVSILEVWQGGMSFHGGFLGVAVTSLLFVRRRHIRLWTLSDLLAVVAPLGLFFGRLANFVNGELYGRAAEVPWAMVFPHDPAQIPRHPSQLYEAALEGLVLFSILFLMARSRWVRERGGLLTGSFLVGYAVARSIAELFREPDGFLGFLFANVTMGQVLSAPMALVGIGFIVHAVRSQSKRTNP